MGQVLDTEDSLARPKHRSFTPKKYLGILECVTSPTGTWRP